MGQPLSSKAISDQGTQLDESTHRTGHFILVAAPFLGHFRPLLALAFNLLSSFPNLVITFVIDITIIPTLNREITRLQAPESCVRRFLVKTVGVDSPDTPPFALVDQSKDGVLKFFSEVNKWGKHPSAIICDFVIPYTPKAIIGAGLEDIPIILWYPSSAGHMAGYHTKGGHFAQIGQRTDELMSSGGADVQGLNRDEVMTKVFSDYRGTQFEWPGHASMFDYEYGESDPIMKLGTDSREGALTQISFTAPQSEIFNQVHLLPIVKTVETLEIDVFPHVSGVIYTSPEAVEPGGKENLEKLFGMPVLAVGPQFSPQWWSHPDSSPWNEGDVGDGKAIDFLEACKVKHGDRSVLFISFGTLFFPVNRPDLVYTLIESLLAAQPPVPFLIATANVPSSIVADIRSHIPQGADGMVADGFVPQMRVLMHKATGWFLTHGGMGSTCEALFAGVPMVFWPFMVDQPIIAAQMSRGMNLAYELVQVRNGTPCIGKLSSSGTTMLGTKEAMLDEMSGVWVQMRGEDGDTKRKRMLEVRDEMRKAWMDENGSAKRAMMSLGKYL